MMIACSWSSVRGLVLIGMSCTLPMASAQQADPATGTVTGQVVCGDTQRPARFAGVLLLAVVGASASTQPNASAVQGSGAGNGYGDGEKVQVLTGLDGSYTASHVAPGDYYAFPAMAGYVLPASLVQAAMDSGADMTKPLAGVPVVHVSAGVTVRQDLVLVRGGVVSGHVLWDDGSPVPRAVVMVQVANADRSKMSMQFGSLEWASALTGGGLSTQADDLGQYRIAGLAAGKYLVYALVVGHGQFATHAGKTTMTSSDVTLFAFAPDAFRKSEAKPIAVSAGQEQSGVDITVNLAGTHSVSGRVVSAEDGHGIGLGVVFLRDAGDTSLMRFAHADATGSFTVQAVPSGSYNLTVGDVVDGGRSYIGAKQTVVVGDTDVAGVNVTLQPGKNAPGNGSP